MKFHLQAYDWDNCANVSHLSMRAFFGLMKMETLICTPYSKDLPLFSYDKICVFGKESLLLELYDTQVEPIDLSSLDAVKMSHQDLKDKKRKPAWYDSLRLSPCTFKVGTARRLAQLSEEMTTAYLNLFPTARTIDPSVKNARNSSYVEGLISKGGARHQHYAQYPRRQAGRNIVPPIHLRHTITNGEVEWPRRYYFMDYRV